MTPEPEGPLAIARKNLYVERAKLSNSLADFHDDDVAGRLPVVKAIKSLSEKIAATYGDPNPQKPKPAKTQAPPPTDRLDALNKLHNTRSNISKWKKKQAAATTPAAAAKAAEKLEALELYKNSLEIFLNEAEADAAEPATEKP